MNQTTNTQTTSASIHNWDAYKRCILGDDYVPLSVSKLPEPTEFEHTVINETIRKYNEKCNTLLFNSLSANSTDVKYINNIPYMSVNADGSYQYNPNKFRQYVRYIDMVANLTPSEKASPNTFKKLISFYVTNVLKD
jgi:hypothetical protein